MRQSYFSVTTTSASGRVYGGRDRFSSPEQATEEAKLLHRMTGRTASVVAVQVDTIATFEAPPTVLDEDLKRSKGFNEEAERMRKRDAAHADAVRDELKVQCDRLVVELGGPADCTFAACTTTELYTLRDELRAMKAGKPLDGTPTLAPYLINFGESK